MGSDSFLNLILRSKIAKTKGFKVAIWPEKNDNERTDWKAIFLQKCL